MGGLKTAALYDGREQTAAARAARWQKYLDQVPARFTDPEDRERRARRLFQMDQQKWSLRAAKARSRAAAARREEKRAVAVLEDLEAASEDLDATGLPGAGSDGVDA